jgi:uncharacterized repeat protein (TIGR01451 family)
MKTPFKHSVFFLILVCFTHNSTLKAQFYGPRTVTEERPGGPNYTSTCDLDSDGDLDVLFTRSGKAWWLQNTGNGNLEKPEEIFSKPGVRATQIIPMGDLDGDGAQDILLTNYVESLGGQSIVWLKNDGNQHFTEEHYINFAYSIWYLLQTDVDADGVKDLVITLPFGVVQMDASWYKNDGHGNFSFGGNLPSNLIYHSCFEDLDGDSDKDMVFALSSDVGNETYWIENTGNNDFSTSQLHHLFPISVPNVLGTFTFDQDQDGDTDVVLWGPGRIYVFTNDGAGGFADYTVLKDSLTTDFSLQVTPYDGDQDGDQDLFFLQFEHAGWFKNESGAFTAQPLSFPNLDGNSGSGVSQLNFRMADLDDDGNADMILTVYGLAAVAFNDGSNHFDDSEKLYPNLEPLYNFYCADADHDGDQDVLTQAPGRLSLLKNDGKGNFSTPVTLCKNLAYNNSELTQTDLNGDNIPDLLATDGLIAWYPGLNNGTFGDRHLIDSIGSYLAVIDWEGDGDTDIFGPFGQGGIIGVRLNDGAGNFGQIQPPGFTLNVWQVRNVVYDFNQDQLPDIMDWGQFELGYFPNLGGGNYGTRQTIGIFAETGYGAEIDDLNGDHIPDFVLTAANANNPDSVTISYYPGSWQGALGPRTILDQLPYWAASYLMEIQDMDKDGDKDLLYARYFESGAQTNARTVWLENDGLGHFTTHINRIIEDYLGALNIADLDQDGYPDIVKGSSAQTDFNPTLSWYKNGVDAPYISGYCFFDINENKVKDSDEPFLRNLRLTTDPATQYAFSEPDGSFRFYMEPGDYTVSYLDDDCWIRTTDSAAYHIVFADSVVNNLYFGFKSATDTAFAGAYVASAPLRCSTLVPFWVTLFNRSCNPAGGEVIVLADHLLSFISAEPSPDFIHGDTLIWTFDTLQPTEFRNIKVFYQVAGSNFAGDTARVQSWVRSAAGNDVPVLTSNYDLASVIRCSFDPNDKLVQRSAIPSQYVPSEQSLLYTVRFQNTGNDTAYQIVIRDPLDYTLDWQSFRPLGSSHPYRSALDPNTGEVVFTFEHIYLPDSNVNQIASQGFVQFEILPKAGLAPGTILPNTASIYFDFNPPVITNTAECRVQPLVETVETQPDPSGISIAPNPGQTYFWVNFNRTLACAAHLSVHTPDGRCILEQHLEAGSRQTWLNAETWPSGVYFVRLDAGDHSGYEGGRFVKK